MRGRRKAWHGGHDVPANQAERIDILSGFAVHPDRGLRTPAAPRGIGCPFEAPEVAKIAALGLGPSTRAKPVTRELDMVDVPPGLPLEALHGEAGRAFPDVPGGAEVNLPRRLGGGLGRSGASSAHIDRSAIGRDVVHPRAIVSSQPGKDLTFRAFQRVGRSAGSAGGGGVLGPQCRREGQHRESDKHYESHPALPIHRTSSPWRIYYDRYQGMNLKDRLALLQPLSLQASILQYTTSPRANGRFAAVIHWVVGR